MWSGGFALISALLSLYICLEFAFPLGVSPSFTFLPFYFFTFTPLLYYHLHRPSQLA